jgi:hypothetical protein
VISALSHRLRRSRRRPLTWLVVGCLALGVVAAHSGLAHDHMGKAAAICLAVIDAAILGVGAALALRSRHRRSRARPVAGLTPFSLPWPAPEPRTRAGPALLQVLLL